MKDFSLTYLFIFMLIIMISGCLRHPNTPVPAFWGLKYSDIVHGVFYVRFTHMGAHLWFNESKFITLTTRSRVTAFPYIDYHFEYPPVIGFIWFISTNIAFRALPERYDADVYESMLNTVAGVHYVINVAVNYASLMAVALLLTHLPASKGVNPRRTLMLLFPTTVFYLSYNWDIVCALFMVLGILLYTRGKPFSSGLTIGLSISTKMLTAPLTLIMLTGYVKERNRCDALRFITGLIVGLTPWLIFLPAPAGFASFVYHISNWYCENCIYQIAVRDLFSPMHRVLATIFISTTTAVASFLYATGRIHLLDACFTTITYVVSLNYISAPQMMLLITPLAIATLKGWEIPVYAAADTLNSAFIVLFFEDEAVRAAARNLGLNVEPGYNPWAITSPAQWVMLARTTLLLLLATTRYITYRKHHNR